MIPSIKRIIVVLGMHRSGTSAITRALEILGVNIGQTLLPPVDGINAKGFFEDVDLTSLNAEILRALGSDWHSLARIAPEDIAVLNEGEYFLRATELLRRKTAAAPIFGFKDPRVAKILPFWRQVFSHCELNADYVLVIRNPLSVVRSLAKRDGLLPEKTYMLWLGHVLNSLAHTEEVRRVLVDYDHFVQEPKEDLEMMADRLDLKFDLQAFQAYRSEFLDEGLRHSVFRSSDLTLDQTCPPLAQEVYSDLLSACIDNKQLDKPAFRKRTSRWVNEFNRFDIPLRLIDDLSRCVNVHKVEVTDLMISALKQDPNAFRDSFESGWYLEKYRDIAEAGVDPYHHFITLGAKEGRDPSGNVAKCVRDGLSDRLRELNARIRCEEQLSQARMLELAEKENKHLIQLQEIRLAHERQKEELKRLHSVREGASLLDLADSRRKIESHVIELIKHEEAHSDRLRLAEQAHEQQREELTRRHADSEQAYVAEIADARRQIEKQLIEAAERERAHSEQILLAEQARDHQTEELTRRHVDRERTLAAELADSRQENENQLMELAKQKEAHSDRLRLAEQAREQQREELTRRHAERQQAHAAELADARRQIEKQLIEIGERERTHSVQIRLAERASENQRDELTRRHADRDRVHLAELADARKQIEKQLIEMAERERAHSEQIRLAEQSRENQREELTRRYADREQAYVAELADARRQIERYSIEWAEREKAHSQQLRAIEAGKQQLREEHRRQHVEQERAIDTQLRAKDAQHNNLTNRWMEVEKAQSEEIARLRLDLNAIRSTLSWRWTAPLRFLATLLGQERDNARRYSSTANEAPIDDKIAHPTDETLSPWAPRSTANLSGKSLFPLSQPKTAASTLDELMSWNAEDFIHSAYYTVVQRAPDAEGLSFYHARLQGGVSKLQVLVEIVDSPEGAENAVKMPGLREIVTLHKLSRVPLFGRLLVGSFFQPLIDSKWSPNRSTSDFNGLLKFDDRRFVQSVYRMVLQRIPDPEGLDFYLSRLRNGVSKIQILAEIIDSQEAVSKAAAILGWRAVVKLHKLSQLPLIGRLLNNRAVADESGGSNGKEIIENDRKGKVLESKAGERPFFSVIMPVYKTPIELLHCAVASVIGQSYSKWELCICDDGSGDDDLRKSLLQYSQSDDRIKVMFLDENSGISSASNVAIAAATGEFIAFLDHDDALALDALAEVASVISCKQDVDVIYTDQDKIDGKGAVVDTFYKPDWSPDYFRRVMYVGHLLVVRASLVEKVGGFHARYDRVQDYEFLLRIAETTSKIAHVRKVLYHWRAIEGSIASTPDAKGGIESLQCDAVRAHLDRIGLKREVFPHSTYAHRTVIKPIKGSESVRVSIVIPSKNHPEHIGRCLRSIFERTTYKNLEVIVVDNGTTDSEALRILRDYPVKVVPYDEKFNYSKANNLGVACSTGEVIVLLNNDTEVLTEDWIEVLLANLAQEDVGAVGAMLVYPDMSIQHAGIVLGPRGTADHVMRGFPWQSDGYSGSLSCVREVSGVTGACLMTRKETYIDIGGLVEHFGTHYQDVDFCLRIRAQGKRILHVPDARLIHYEGASRGGEYDLLDRLLLQDTWAKELVDGDPYFNPAFSLNRLDYSLHALAVITAESSTES
jgi:GT2 family glycosyltransferase